MSTAAERLRDLILSALSTSSEPLPPRDIHAYCGGADKQKTYAQLHYLKTRGLILLDPDEHGAPRYRLPAQTAVETVTQEIAMPVPGLETEPSASADLDAESDIGTHRHQPGEPHYEPDAEGDDLDIGPPPLPDKRYALSDLFPGAGNADAGDEFERTSDGCCGRCQTGRGWAPVATSLSRLIWAQISDSAVRRLTLDLSGPHPRLHTSGAFEIRADLLLEIVDMIENRYREAA